MTLWRQHGKGVGMQVRLNQAWSHGASGKLLNPSELPLKMGCCQPYKLMPDARHLVNFQQMLIHYSVFSHVSYAENCRSVVLPLESLHSFLIHKADWWENKRTTEIMRSCVGKVAKKTRTSETLWASRFQLYWRAVCQCVSRAFKMCLPLRKQLSLWAKI